MGAVVNVTQPDEPLPLDEVRDLWNQQRERALGDGSAITQVLPDFLPGQDVRAALSAADVAKVGELLRTSHPEYVASALRTLRTRPTLSPLILAEATLTKLTDLCAGADTWHGLELEAYASPLLKPDATGAELGLFSVGRLPRAGGIDRVYLDVASAGVLEPDTDQIHGHFATGLEPLDVQEMARAGGGFPAVISACPSHPSDAEYGYGGPHERLVNRLAAFYLRHGRHGAAALTVSGDEETDEWVAGYVDSLNAYAESEGYPPATFISLPPQLRSPQARPGERPSTSSERFGPLSQQPPGSRSPHGRAQPGGSASRLGPDGPVDR